MHLLDLYIKCIYWIYVLHSSFLPLSSLLFFNGLFSMNSFNYLILWNPWNNSFERISWNKLFE